MATPNPNIQIGSLVFAATSWGIKKKTWLSTQQNPFLKANAEMIQRILETPDTGPSIVMNISAACLLGFSKTGEKYLSAYDQPVIAGKKRGPSQTRLYVDSLYGLGGNINDYCFGAIELGGTGMRFYGEYCMVLNDKIVDKEKSLILDRNSYDLIRPPFDKLTKSRRCRLAKMLIGNLKTDLVSLLALKLLPSIKEREYLITAGTISDAILHDEEYVEVLKYESFTIDDVREIRTSTEDEVIQNQISARFERGIMPMVPELIWSFRRLLVERTLMEKDITLRTVSSTGRGNRWR